MLTRRATNCTFVNCDIDYFLVDSGEAWACRAINCRAKSFNSHRSYNCEAINCTFERIFHNGGEHNTVVRCVADELRYSSSQFFVATTVLFDSTITTITWGTGDFNAASQYVDANTLVLGTDNSNANFTSLGTITTKGYSTELDNATRAEFGNFQPLAGSMLIGAGAIGNCPYDMDGKTRTTNATIGAYEYVEETP